jgi:hypothetical protein
MAVIRNRMTTDIFMDILLRMTVRFNRTLQVRKDIWSNECLTEKKGNYIHLGTGQPFRAKLG